MLRRDAAARDALRVECNYLKQFTVAFEFLLILLCRVHEQFEQRLTTFSFVARNRRISNYRRRKCDQGVQLTHLPVA